MLRTPKNNDDRLVTRGSVMHDGDKITNLPALEEGLSFAERIGHLDAFIAAAGLGRSAGLLVQPHLLVTKNGEMIHASTALMTLLGMETHAQSGFAINFLEKLHIHDRVKAGLAIASVFDRQSDEDNAAPIELRLACLPSQNADFVSAQYVWVEAGFLYLPEDDAVLIGLRDINAQKQAQEVLSRTSQNAEAANNAKSRFLATISHEIRTPLNAILGFSQLMGSQKIVELNDKKRREYADLINESASHLMDVLNDLLDQSKLENGKYSIEPTRFSLANCLDKALRTMAGQAKMRNIDIVPIGFSHNSNDTLPEIVADEKAIRQILFNLISNAIKFSDDGQQIMVKAHRLARNVVISVEDHGIGISKENLDKLCAPFFQVENQADRRFEGTGLGLSVVKGLLDLHQGKINIDSVEGEGACVTITLPINGASAEHVPGEDKIIELSTDDIYGHENEADRVSLMAGI